MNDLEGALEDLKDDKHSIYTAVTELLHTDLFNSSSPEVEQFLRQVALILQSADLVTNSNSLHPKIVAAIHLHLVSIFL